MSDYFFFFSKVLSIFIFPLPAIILISVFISIFLIRGFRNKLLSIFPILILWSASTFSVSQYLIETLEDDYPPKEIQSIHPAEAIVVLGGMINILVKHQSKIELGESVERLTESALLWKAKKAKYILITGGSGILFFQGKSEAELAKKFLISIGVDEKFILTEEKSRNTIENALYTFQILQEKKINKIILVTSAFHLKRSEALFKKVGFEVETFPTDYKSLLPVLNWETVIPTISALGTTSIAIKEWIGIFVYRFQKYVTLPQKP
ncbi:MAG: YdcF family protein [Leptospiraceae bacterium]|nr:YdcF family protein [Leptospiraceae bacterium]MCK6382319.1 YdcF family protein [Leptospiraceae bacterium]NUM41032.1 YdcF family protein [Leptospiraceae bacterium]